MNAKELIKAKEIKKSILENDPQNLKKNNLKLALIEFEKRFSKEKELSSEKVIEPLVKYIDFYGKNHKENIWLLEMIITQYLFINKENEKALIHARNCFKCAPKTLRKELSKTIDYLKKQIESNKK